MTSVDQFVDLASSVPVTWSEIVAERREHPGIDSAIVSAIGDHERHIGVLLDQKRGRSVAAKHISSVNRYLLAGHVLGKPADYCGEVFQTSAALLAYRQFAS